MRGKKTSEESSLVEKIKAVRGMHDITPARSRQWAAMETQLARLLGCYGYAEIRTPIVESTSLFKRSIGEVTDIVEKEMYTFGDRNDDSLSLRPEGTASCVRSVIEQGLLDIPQKLWYCGPMFRYERPQKGRQRQFHQIGGEAFGFEGVSIEVETLLMHKRFWEALGLSEHVELEVNTIGSLACRSRYREALVAYLERFRGDLDADSQRRLETNPLRILDSKDSGTQRVLQEAPVLDDYLHDDSRAQFELLQQKLSDLGISARRNAKLVRGLDYYNDTVFEWVSGLLGAQATVCAGGRYDSLVEQLGGKPAPAFGFAMGLERLMLMLEETEFAGLDVPEMVDIYVVVADSSYQDRAFEIAEALRNRFPDKTCYQHLNQGSMKSQFKRADRFAASYVLVIAEQEFISHSVAVKNMQTGEQQSCDVSDSYDSLFAALRFDA